MKLVKLLKRLNWPINSSIFTDFILVRYWYIVALILYMKENNSLNKNLKSIKTKMYLQSKKIVHQIYMELWFHCVLHQCEYWNSFGLNIDLLTFICFFSQWVRTDHFERIEGFMGIRHWKQYVKQSKNMCYFILFILTRVNHFGWHKYFQMDL